MLTQWGGSCRPNIVYSTKWNVFCVLFLVTIADSSDRCGSKDTDTHPQSVLYWQMPFELFEPDMHIIVRQTHM